MIADKWTMIDDSLDCLSSVPRKIGLGYYGSVERELEMQRLDKLLENPEFRKRFGEIMERLIWGDE